MQASLRDLARSIDLQSLVPKCGGCSENFDTFLRAPYILSCCHTLCLTCLTQQTPQEKKKRRCPICRAKYVKYTMNSALLNLITRIRELIIRYQRSSASCGQCGKQTIIIDMRRCRTCEIELHKMLEYSLQTCCICLQCCVQYHNGHILQEIFTTLDKFENDTMHKSFSLTTYVLSVTNIWSNLLFFFHKKYIHHKFKLNSVHSNPSSSSCVSSTFKTSDSPPTRIVRTGNDSRAEYVNISTNSDSELKFLPEDITTEFHSAEKIRTECEISYPCYGEVKEFHTMAKIRILEKKIHEENYGNFN